MANSETISHNVMTTCHFFPKNSLYTYHKCSFFLLPGCEILPKKKHWLGPSWYVWDDTRPTPQHITTLRFLTYIYKEFHVQSSQFYPRLVLSWEGHFALPLLALPCQKISLVGSCHGRHWWLTGFGKCCITVFGVLFCKDICSSWECFSLQAHSRSSIHKTNAS